MIAQLFAVMRSKAVALMQARRACIGWVLTHQRCALASGQAATAQRNARGGAVDHDRSRVRLVGQDPPYGRWLFATVLALGSSLSFAAGGNYEAVERSDPMGAAAPASQSAEQAAANSAGCLGCHTQTDMPTMHDNPAVKLGCVDCHGGNAGVQVAAGAVQGDAVYTAAMEQAHVLPRFPDAWDTSATPERTYTLLNAERPEFVRFINPSDYRVNELACGACHQPVIDAARRSLMATGAMFWAGAAYNNGILPFKQSILGEAYTDEGHPGSVLAPIPPTPEMKSRGILAELLPLPAFETIKPGDNFRVFERGGRNILSLFPETGVPNIAGNIQRLEEPGRPDIRQSNRGPGTGARISVPVLNMHKTRLNDPMMWFAGTNDQPGDYRHSGCASCHVVYANDRDPRHSGPYAAHGHAGTSASVDPTIPKDLSGHPLKHGFTRAIPSSQCMVCHMHQPNMFMNTFLGYTMWDYESDAPHMWPEQQQYPDAEQMRAVLERNPEGAAPRGKWGDIDFLAQVWDMNPQLSDTQFADYHGHGWNFRGVYKRDRDGNLLDAEGAQVANDDPEKFKKAVHLSSIHVDVGMHCVDCHFSSDSHGNGHIGGEVALAVEVGCKDCHGDATTYPSLYTSNPAALNGGQDLRPLRTPDGRRRFEWIGDTLFQRSMMDPELEWAVSLVRDSVTPGNAHYNAKAARAKTVGSDTGTQAFGPDVDPATYAHSSEKMECYACHTSWTTTCGGCHLPVEANWKTERHHYEGGATRNYATYNPQVARDEVFMLGRHSPAKGGKIAPVRSSSALVLSSTNSSRERIYVQQPPIAASGFSSQAMNPHYPHTERKTETRVCSDCHLSADGDNNAILAQTLMLGTKFIDFVGYHAYVGGAGEVAAVQVTEWDEPQAVIGSYLHRYAYPDWFKEHQQREGELQTGHRHRSGEVGCVQLRGEYLYAAAGDQGLRVYDVANIANKGYSQRIVTAPFSPLGQGTRVKSENATCLHLVTTQPVHPERNQGDLMRVDNLEQPFHPIYNYALVTDALEGLVLVDVNTLADAEPRNNDLSRALTWNPDGVLNGARHIEMAGYRAYISTPRGVVVVNLDTPLQPRVEAQIALPGARAAAVQFRYLFVVDDAGLKAVDVTDPARPRVVDNNTLAFKDARRVFVVRDYAYVAAADEGLVLVDIRRPEAMREYQRLGAAEGIADARDVVVATTNASLFAYVADGREGLKVLQLTSPASQPNFYGFSPAPKPELIAHYPTRRPALSLSRALERDRGVDETGGQVAVFGRRGARPLNLEEMQRLYLNANGEPWYVHDQLPE
jgi:hypothetical protein